ncbi:MAG: NB-ARC domain-containing protein, partial [bacterium]
MENKTNVTSTAIASVFTTAIKTDNKLRELLCDYINSREQNVISQNENQIHIEIKPQEINKIHNKIIQPGYLKSVAHHVKKSQQTSDEKYFITTRRIDERYLKQLAAFYLKLVSEKTRCEEIVKTKYNDALENTLHMNKRENETLDVSVVYRWPDMKEFIARKQELNKLSNLLNQYGFAIVMGIRGIGKTSLVQAYLTKYSHLYKHIIWIRVRETISASMINVLNGSKHFNFIADASRTTEQLVDEILTELRHYDGNNLLVFDDVGNTSQIHEVICAFESLQINWKSVFISNYNISASNVIELLPLSEADALQMLKSIYQDELVHEKERDFALNYIENNKKDILNLLEIINYHPLIIELIAKVDVSDEFLNLDDIIPMIKHIKSLSAEELQTPVIPRTKRASGVALRPKEITPMRYIRAI